MFVRRSLEERRNGHKKQAENAEHLEKSWRSLSHGPLVSSLSADVSLHLKILYFKHKKQRPCDTKAGVEEEPKTKCA